MVQQPQTLICMLKTVVDRAGDSSLAYNSSKMT